MPLWTIYHPVDAYTPADRQAMAAAITTLYPILPKFYVGVVFHAMTPDTLFIGGEPRDNFVRIAVDHIARQFSDDDRRGRWLTWANTTLQPFLGDRGFDWELHIDETPPNIWLIQGMRPPGPNSEDEKRWIEANRPLPLTGA